MESYEHLQCPLCNSTQSAHFWRDKRRNYVICSQCELVFVPVAEHISPTQEKKQYDMHQNSPNDTRYRQFLSRLVNPLRRRLPDRSKGLDFGSGPGPTVSVMLEEMGHQVTLYDKFYAPDTAVLRYEYDFITCTEVVEHLVNVGQDLDTLWGLLTTGGILAVMTKTHEGRERFSQWHYKNDPTHIVFFSKATMKYLANHWQASLELIEPDVFIFEKG
ncbi:MAG: class I SAM-dependent methyltransferase [Gammaproteobacteria bacterium]|nr:class I SAM-dependent methyltransferase [Gammaproteobacteria bacterium]